jgi:peptide/nickel transport system ATP-binding protein
MSALLDVRHLTVIYGRAGGVAPAVRDVSFSLARGKAVGLVGESGSGKSTIAGAIVDLLPGDVSLEGTIVFDDTDLRILGTKARRQLLGRQIGVVFQDPFTSLNPSLRVGSQIAEPLARHLGLGRAAAFARACELLADMHIHRPRDVAAAYPHQLSGGMRQRALIAAALACEPALLILDEPTTALDVTIEAQILSLVADLRRRKSVSLLFISHNLRVVRSICDEVVVMYASQVVEHGSVAQVLGRPQHPYTKGLLASSPRLVAAPRNARLPTIPGQMTATAGEPDSCLFAARCPFAESRCRTEAQSLRTNSDDSSARCWKAAAVDDWLTEPPAAAATSVDATRSLVKANEVRKGFQTRGGASAVRIDLSGKKPILRYEPEQLMAVDGVSLSVAPGEVVGLVGESGSGKSTLGRLLLRLVEASSGTIEFEGRDVINLPNSRARQFRGDAQIVFQNVDSSLNPRVSVRATLERPLVLFGKGDAAQRRRRVDELLDVVRLPRSYAGRYAHQLSGGEKQRVAIARALAPGPKFIVCDEPVSALDLSVQAAILNLLADLRDEFGLAYLFISHDLAVVAQVSDRIAVMYRGALCETGTARDVLAPPHHPYTEMLLSSLAVLHGVMSPKTRNDIPAGKERAIGCRFQAQCPRKIGAICETVSPPLRALTATHSVACHLEQIS